MCHFHKCVAEGVRHFHKCVAGGMRHFCLFGAGSVRKFEGMCLAVCDSVWRTGAATMQDYWGLVLDGVLKYREG